MILRLLVCGLFIISIIEMQQNAYSYYSYNFTDSNSTAYEFSVQRALQHISDARQALAYDDMTEVQKKLSLLEQEIQRLIDNSTYYNLPPKLLVTPDSDVDRRWMPEIYQ
jgi:hypothetical protein